MIIMLTKTTVPSFSKKSANNEKHSFNWNVVKSSQKWIASFIEASLTLAILVSNLIMLVSA